MPKTNAETENTSRLAKSAVWVWAAFVAVAANACNAVSWWHPACDEVGNGPAYFAWGFPLPYRQFGGASSLQDRYLPWALAIDLLVTTLVVFFTLRPAARELTKRSKRGSEALAIVGGALLVLFGGLFALSVRAFDRPDTSLGTYPSESYWAYRPWPVARFEGHADCSN